MRPAAPEHAATMLRAPVTSCDAPGSNGWRPHALTGLAAIALAASAAWLSGCSSGGGAASTSDGASSADPAPAPSSAPSASGGGGTRVEQADTLAKEGRLDEALAQLAKAIEENPTLTTAYVKMGDIHMGRGDYPAAERAFREASDRDPRNFEAAYNHGLALQLLERVSDAIKAYLRALSIRPDDREANLNLATAYLQLGEATQALPYAERAAQIDPSHGPSRVNLGAVYNALTRYEDAVREYEAAAELLDLDKSPELLLNLADTLGKINRHQEMANTLERLVAASPSAQAYERLGSARFRLRDYEGSLGAFRKAIELDSKHFPAWNGVGVCLLNKYLMSEQRDRTVRDEAVAALRQSLRINPRQPKIVELASKYAGTSS